MLATLLTAIEEDLKRAIYNSGAALPLLIEINNEK